MIDHAQLLKEIVAAEAGSNLEEIERIARAIADDAEMNRRMAQEWRAAPRRTQEEICRYYAESKTWLVQTYNQGRPGLVALARRERGTVPPWARAFRPLLPEEGASVLDYGGGFLKDTWFLALEGVRVALAEIDGPVSRTIQAFIGAVGEPNVSVLPISGDPPELGAHDGAVCFEVLEHMADPVGTLCRIVSAVRPSGPVALSVSFGSPSHAPYHIAENSRFGDPEVWRGELHRAGLEPVWGDQSNVGVWRKRP